MVAGLEFGELFGFVVEGKKPPDEIPTPTSVESKFEDSMQEIRL